MVPWRQMVLASKLRQVRLMCWCQDFTQCRIDTMRSQVRTTFIAALAFLRGQRLINGLHMNLIGTRRTKSLHKL